METYKTYGPNLIWIAISQLSDGVRLVLAERGWRGGAFEGCGQYFYKS